MQDAWRYSRFSVIFRHVCERCIPAEILPDGIFYMNLTGRRGGGGGGEYPDKFSCTVVKTVFSSFS